MGNRLAGGCLGCGLIELNIRKITTPASGEVRFELIVVHTHDKPLRIQGGQPLTLLVDGQELRLDAKPGSQSFFERSRGGMIDETVYYPVTASTLRTLSSAQAVTVRITGSEEVAVRSFSATNFEWFQRYVAEHVN